MNKILLNTFIFSILTYTSTVNANFLTINYDAWIGHHINELTNSWGYADESFKAPNGNDVYVYIVTKESNIVYKTIGVLKFKNKRNKFCKKYFEANNSIIVAWDMKGNNCQSLIGDRRTHPTIPPKIKSKQYAEPQAKQFGTKSPEYQLANILKISEICTSVTSNNMQLEIEAAGEVDSIGWSNPQLLPWIYLNGKPHNGILDFTFIANKPKSSHRSNQYNPINVKVTIKDANWIKGIAIHTSTNSLQVEKGKCAQSNN